ncbi:hypothetical protein TNCV_3281281 [Trichonephila clavipes]|nr:hypothetical protein TNCV_3281281 [Trichonephila clavipes]
MHDGAPAQFSIMLHNHLYASYPGRRIGLGKTVAWPTRFSDLNPLDIFFKNLKSLVYETSIARVDDINLESSSLQLTSLVQRICLHAFHNLISLVSVVL